jgi:hypothetical protein
MRLHFARNAAGLAVAACLVFAPAGALADARAPIAPGVVPTRGRPDVKLDRLEFPKDLPRSAALERHFRFHLRRAARKADRGAGRGAKIEYRVRVEELEASERGGVLSVRCTALGRLPGGKSARSHIAFGGNPRQRERVLKNVLEIVARGVVTRLAALERERRAEHARAASL